MNQEEIESPQKGKSNREIFLRPILVIFKFLRTIFDITDGADIEASMESIRNDIYFKGHKLWVLIFSILIASIGLDVNSIPLVIGAMLISPLMGPIIGIGMAVGTFDLALGKASLRNFAIASAIAIATSTLYFFVSPFGEAQSEILARVRPTMLDVLVAFFGGLAGIMAASRKNQTVVVAGVAIATALMPPLCTAGFAIASGQLWFFLGASYLYFINSVFIALATYIVVRILRFPIKVFLNKKIEKRTKSYMGILAFIVMVPSLFTGYNAIKETSFTRTATLFVTENFLFDESKIINQTLTYTNDSSKIELYVIGEIIPYKEVKKLNTRLLNYGLTKTKLYIHQGKDDTDRIADQLSHQVKSGILEDIYRKNEEALQTRDHQIEFLENQLVKYKKLEIPIQQICDELRIHHPELLYIGFSEMVIPSKNSIDTIPVVLTHWNSEIKEKNKRKNEEKIAEFLKLRLHRDSLLIIEHKGL